MKILVIEDDSKLSAMLEDIFHSEYNNDGDEVAVAPNGALGLELATTQEFDVIILDLMLPDMNGEQILVKLRKQKLTPVIILSAVATQEKRVDLLNKGADDYLCKPFFRDELIARINATIRRYNKTFFELSYTFDGLHLDFVSKTVTYNGASLNIVGKVYDMLEYLVKNKEIVITKQQLFDYVCGFYSETVDKVIDVYAYRIRKTLGEIGFADCIKTIKTVGFMWTEKARKVV
ncbi:MAG: response regulator transcription factor [Clostridia bacterium]